MFSWILLIVVCVLVASGLHLKMSSSWLATLVSSMLSPIVYCFVVIAIDGDIGAFGGMVAVMSFAAAVPISFLVGGAVRAWRN